MKILVSTRKTQGLRKRTDFCFVPDGEPVIPCSITCDHDVDGDCGCRRSMIGIHCRKATTTVEVVETNMNEADFIKLVVDECKRYFGLVEDVQRIVRLLQESLEQFDVGMILECRDSELKQRKE